MDAGTHHVVWDSAADGCKAVSDKMKATLSLVTMPEKYIVVDLSGGHIAQHFAVSYLDAPPAGGFNTIEYKTKKLVLKLVPAGTFIMGSPDDEPSRSADEQQHVVAITKPFYMAIFELTRGQYETITGLSAKDRSGIGATRPFTLWSATNVRGEAAKPTNFKLVGTLSHKTGLSFEFPSEAQWEYACRAGTTTMRYSMADLSTIARYKDVTDADKAYPGWYGEVGTFPPNPWGFYDMYGSAWEWTRDYYAADYAAAAGSVNPQVVNRLTSDQQNKTLRGGGYYSAATSCRSAIRLSSWSQRDENHYDSGFRLIVQP